EDEERAHERREAVEGQAVRDRAHRVLAHAEADDAAAHVAARHGPLARDVGEVRARQVGRAAEEAGERPRYGVQRRLGRLARRDLAAGLEARQLEAGEVGCAALEDLPQLARLLRVLPLVAREELLPRPPRRLPALAHGAGVR